MGWLDAITYIESVADSKGFDLWPDGFAFDNIPSNLLDRAYHITVTDLSGISQNQSDQETEVDMELRLFFKGFSNPRDAILTAVEETQGVVQLAVDAKTRISDSGILNMTFNSATVEPLGATNDNSVVVVASFRARVVLQVC